MATELTIASQQSLSSEDALNPNISRYEDAPVCCNHCCIKERRRSANEEDDDGKREQDDNKNEDEYYNENLTLNDDIWALAYVIARNRGALPVSYCILISVIYTIQVFSLIVMIWGFSTTINYDVITKYQIDGECESFANNTTSLKCDKVSLVEHPASTQEYVSLNYEIFKWDSAHPLLFGLSVVLSWCLLSIYTLKTFTNPIMMMVIGSQYTKMKWSNMGWPWHLLFSNCGAMYPTCSNCTNRCSSISDLLYGLARANIILSMASYATGFVMLITYPLYFGIDSPTDIILAPIGIVFILEIDDWAFEFVKSFYVETEMEDLWKFCKSDFMKGSFGNLHASIWMSISFHFGAVNFILFMSTLCWTVLSDTIGEATGLVGSAFTVGFSGVGIIFSLVAWVLAAILISLPWPCCTGILERCKCRPRKFLIVYNEGITRSVGYNALVTN